ncbi:hypothetical protein BZG36_01705 [Bifiguratus adelaidae]|uniref:RNI-like protein n=1 Tax=Bifiguratus adelaidae TaxID=1938954 RepID=A0A261Y4R9_9FUNG|nr:hypothetical protein BZG36_01705 [Bifiguratus adelaidae]
MASVGYKRLETRYSVGTLGDVVLYGRDGGIAVVEALRALASHVSSSEEGDLPIQLSFRHHCLRDEGLEVIAEWLASPWGEAVAGLVDMLDFTANQVGDDGIAACARMIGQCPRLSTLLLGHNEFGWTALEVLAFGVRRHQRPTMLSLSSNILGDGGVETLLDALVDDIGIKSEQEGPVGSSPLLTLELSATDAHDPATRAIARFLRNDDVLRTLALSGNNFTRKGVGRLVTVLERWENVRLQTLDIFGSWLDGTGGDDGDTTDSDEGDDVSADTLTEPNAVLPIPILHPSSIMPSYTDFPPTSIHQGQPAYTYTASSYLWTSRQGPYVQMMTTNHRLAQALQRNIILQRQVRQTALQLLCAARVVLFSKTHLSTTWTLDQLDTDTQLAILRALDTMGVLTTAQFNNVIHWAMDRASLTGEHHKEELLRHLGCDEYIQRRFTKRRKGV